LPYGYGILFSALILALALGIGFAVLPLYAEARRAGGRALPPGTLTSIAIGLGFIATELVLLQRLTLYLGQPSLALAVGIAALLGGAACGSAVSSRVRGGTRLPALLSAVGLLLTLALLPVITDATLAAPLAIRVAVGLAAATLVGLPLGSVFPNVVSEVGAKDAKLVNWVWAVNGTASVVGAVLATALALSVGFTGLGAAAVICYGLAALSTADFRRFRVRRDALAARPAAEPRAARRT
jgi:MFS family permease